MKKIMIACSIVLATVAASAQTKVGNMAVSAFKKVNAQGAKLVNAIKPTQTPLSAADQALLQEIAAGGTRQLAMSQAALNNVTGDDVRVLAQSEVEEQTGIANKLREIATAKGMTMPDSSPTSATGTTGLSGTEADLSYINESGVKGHQLLEATMKKVSSQAKDPALKALAAATLPVIRTHLAVSKVIQKKLGATSTSK